MAPGQILNPVRRIFSPARIHVGEIEAIDLEQRQVLVSRYLDGRQQTLEYDHVVLCLGSVDNLEAYPGLLDLHLPQPGTGCLSRPEDHRQSPAGD